MKKLDEVRHWQEMVNEVILGDCFEGMGLTPDSAVDCVITDPPYGTTALEWDNELDFDKFWMEIKRIRKENAPIIIFGSEPFSSKVRLSNLAEYRYDWVWDKVAGANFMNLKNRPFKTHENIMVFSGSADFTFNPQRVMRTEASLERTPIGKERKRNRKSAEGTHYGKLADRIYKMADDGKKHPIDIIQFNKYSSSDNESRYNYSHPTKKPLNLITYLIQTYSNSGDIIFDPFMGSWTAARACINLGRSFIGFDTGKEYCQIGEKRLAQKVLL